MRNIFEGSHLNNEIDKVRCPSVYAFRIRCLAGVNSTPFMSSTIVLTKIKATLHLKVKATRSPDSTHFVVLRRKSEVVPEVSQLDKTTIKKTRQN